MQGRAPINSRIHEGHTSSSIRRKHGPIKRIGSAEGQDPLQKETCKNNTTRKNTVRMTAMLRTALFLTAFMAPALLVAPARAEGDPAQKAAAQRYADCVAAVEADPEQAVALASQWRDVGGGIPAKHCLGLALFEAGKA